MHYPLIFSKWQQCEDLLWQWGCFELSFYNLIIKWQMRYQDSINVAEIYITAISIFQYSNDIINIIDYHWPLLNICLSSSKFQYINAIIIMCICIVIISFFYISIIIYNSFANSSSQSQRFHWKFYELRVSSKLMTSHAGISSLNVFGFLNFRI